MAWVHVLSCIIYIRKESNILDADNLTHRLEREKKGHVQGMFQLLCE